MGGTTQPFCVFHHRLDSHVSDKIDERTDLIQDRVRRDPPPPTHPLQRTWPSFRRKRLERNPHLRGSNLSGMVWHWILFARATIPNRGPFPHRHPPPPPRGALPFRARSKEGHEFYVDRKCAMISGTIKAMLSGGFMESKGEIRFAEIRGAILEKVIQYVYYKVKYSKGNVAPPEFEIEPEIALELLMAANYLDC